MGAEESLRRRGDNIVAKVYSLKATNATLGCEECSGLGVRGFRVIVRPLRAVL